MFFRVMMFTWEFMLDLIAVMRMMNDEKDLEIILLRQQLRIVERKQKRGPQIPRWQKVPLAVLVGRLKDKVINAQTTLTESVRLFKPETVMGWHHELVRRKWTFKQGRRPGRPPIDRELEEWMLKVAREYPGLGCEKLEGELRKIGLEVSATTIRTVLHRHHVPPAPERSREGSSWRTFLGHYKKQFLPCDFFTVETLTLHTMYALFFIEHGTRRVYVAGCTAHPSRDWVTQQARQMTWELENRDPAMRYLIHDHDTKFTHSFDTAFEAAGIEIVNIPYHAPNANAIAERRVRSVREECLDHLIILNARHLRHVLQEYVDYYNERRPHQGLAQGSPLGLAPVSPTGPIQCRNVLGGTYYQKTSWIR